MEAKPLGVEAQETLKCNDYFIGKKKKKSVTAEGVCLIFLGRYLVPRWVLLKLLTQHLGGDTFICPRKVDKEELVKYLVSQVSIDQYKHISSRRSRNMMKALFIQYQSIGLIWESNHINKIRDL